MNMFSLAVLLGLISVGKCQCGSYATSSSGSRAVLNACTKSGSAWVTLKCKGSDIYYETYGTAACSGTATSSVNFTSVYPGEKKCTGSSCQLTGASYNASTCTGAANGDPSTVAMDPQCHGPGRKTYCDSSFYYLYNYADATCPTAANVNSSIIKFRMGCSSTPFGSSSGGTKFSGCQMSEPQPSLVFGGGSQTIAYHVNPNSCTGNPDVSFEGPLSSQCSPSGTSSNKNYCSGNGGALWFYIYNDTMCSASSLNGASYINSGCGVSMNIFSGFNPNYTLSLSCNGGPAPPKIDFQGAPVANLLAYADSSCSTFVTGTYMRADGTCVPSSDGTATTVKCVAGKAHVTDYNVNNAQCTMNLNRTQILDSSCQLLQGSDINGRPTYGKVASCGASGPVDPAKAPNVQVLGGVSRVEAWLAVMLALFCLVTA